MLLLVSLASTGDPLPTVRAVSNCLLHARRGNLRRHPLLFLRVLGQPDRWIDMQQSHACSICLQVFLKNNICLQVDAIVLSPSISYSLFLSTPIVGVSFTYFLLFKKRIVLLPSRKVQVESNISCIIEGQIFTLLLRSTELRARCFSFLSEFLVYLSLFFPQRL